MVLKRLRPTRNPLDRNNRNDINYNWEVIERDLDNVDETISNSIEQIEKDLEVILDGRQLEELFDAATDARTQANEARINAGKANDKAEFADEKGIYANEQGDYAKEQGLYAKEKADYAEQVTADIEQANTDLSNIKLEAVEATQRANEQADRAEVATDRVEPLIVELENELPNITNLKHVGDWSESKEYKKNEEVLFNKSTYRATVDNIGVQPSNDKIEWQLIAQGGTDGQGAVASVNGIGPDSEGNVDLGDIASKQYVDDKIGDVDLSALETKQDAESKLVEAKGYTDTHADVKGSSDAFGHVKLSNLTESESSVSDGIAATPLAVKTVNDKIDSHTNDKGNPHEVNKEQVGLSDVDNVKQMPISGGTFTGIAKAQSNVDYTVAQMRNIIYLEDTGEGVDNSIGNDGDMLVVYEGGS